MPQRTEEAKLAPASDTMWEYLREYDTIIIVDDSASMKMGDRWQAVRIPVRYEEYHLTHR